MIPLLLLSLALPVALGPGPCNEPPTIVLVMTDDQGYGDIGLRDDEVHTPHLDALFRDGVEFTRFYTAAPVCSPTRASVLTARHPARLAIDGANDGHLAADEPNLARALGARGYRTGFFGKWHLGTLTRDVVDSNRGGRPKHAAHYAPPWDRGFDVSFATEAKVPTFDPMWKPGTRELYGTRYWESGAQREPGLEVDPGTLAGDDSAIVMTRALEFLDAAAEQDTPALAIVWLHAPHEPVVRDPDQDPRFAHIADPARRVYLGCLAAIDAEVGALRSALEEHAREHGRPAALFFCSDNGPEHKRGPGSTGGLRGRKRDLFEGGLRVPAALWWTSSAAPSALAKAERGTRHDAAACTSDLAPTALALAGVALGDTAFGPPELDGANLLPRLAEPTSPRGYGFRSGRQRAWIRGRWKVHSSDRGRSWQLFDLVNDPGETTAVNDPRRRAALVAAHRAWEHAVLADRPAK